METRQQRDERAELREAVDGGYLLDRQLEADLGGAPPGAPLAAGDGSRDGGPEREERQDSVVDHQLVLAARAGDLRAKARLVEACMPLITSMARTYRSGQVERQELLQEGVVGVLRALERFDPGRGVPFWGYAKWWVRHAMQQLVSELTRPLVLSDRALRHLSRVRQAHDEAVREHGRVPTAQELAARSGLRVDLVRDLLSAERAPRSLEGSAGDHDTDVGSFGDLLVDPLAEDGYERILDAIEVQELHRLLAGLSNRERAVLSARYGLHGPEQSLRGVGESLGLSGERVRQIERLALGKLAARMK